MHNLHFIRANAPTAKSACIHFEDYFNPKVKALDFSQLRVNPDHFKKVGVPFNGKGSFVEYLNRMIDPENNMWVLRDLIDDLILLKHKDTAIQIEKFLSDSGYKDPYDLESLFEFEIIGAFNQDGSDTCSCSPKRWNLKEFTTANINLQLSEKHSLQIDVFGDISQIDCDSEWDSFGITDFIQYDSNEAIFIVVIEVSSQ